MPFAKLAGTTTAGRCLPIKRPDAHMGRLAARGGASAAMSRPVMFLLHYLREFFEVADTPLPLLLPEPNLRYATMRMYTHNTTGAGGSQHEHCACKACFAAAPPAW